MGADFVSGYNEPGVLTVVSYDDSELELDQGIIVIKHGDVGVHDEA